MAPARRILVIDDDPAHRGKTLRFLDRMHFQKVEAVSVQEAVGRLSNDDPFSMAMIRSEHLDHRFIGLIQSLKSNYHGIGILLLTNKSHPEAAISLLNKGMIDQVVAADNPAGIFSALRNEFLKQNLLHKSTIYRKQIDNLQSERKWHLKKARELEEVYDSTLDNLMTALDLRDVETFGHSRTVAKYSQVLARLLDITDETTLLNIRKGALLHDIGKIAIPDSILKKPSPLSPKEWDKIKLHPTLGFGLIKEIKLVDEIGNIILCHHERYDGRGYPKRLQKDDIPAEARIFALADALDAITSHRPYRRERSFSAAKAEITNKSGTQFDPAVVDAFCSLPIENWEKIRHQSTLLLPHFEEFMRVSH